MVRATELFEKVLADGPVGGSARDERRVLRRCLGPGFAGVGIVRHAHGASEGGKRNERGEHNASDHGSGDHATALLLEVECSKDQKHQRDHAGYDNRRDLAGLGRRGKRSVHTATEDEESRENENVVWFHM